jgi:hypothetical protein
MQESTSNQPSHSTGQGTSQDLPFSNFSPWSDLLADEQLVLFTNVNVDSTSDSKFIPEHEPQSSMPALSPSSSCIGSSHASGEAGLGENTTLPVIETTQEDGDVKRNQRRALNRENARQSRQRKRTQIAGRQRELSDLVAENQRLLFFKGV